MNSYIPCNITVSLYFTPLYIAIQVTLTDTPSGSGYTSSVLLYMRRSESINVYIELYFITPLTNQQTSVVALTVVVIQ